MSRVINLTSHKDYKPSDGVKMPDYEVISASPGTSRITIEMKKEEDAEVSIWEDPIIAWRIPKRKEDAEQGSPVYAVSTSDCDDYDVKNESTIRDNGHDVYIQAYVFSYEYVFFEGDRIPREDFIEKITADFARRRDHYLSSKDEKFDLF